MIIPLLKAEFSIQNLKMVGAGGYFSLRRKNASKGQKYKNNRKIGYREGEYVEERFHNSRYFLVILNYYKCEVRI